MAEQQTITDGTERWTPIVIVDGGADGGIEVGNRLAFPSASTRTEAWATAQAAMLATVGAVGFSVEPRRLAA